MNTIYEKNMWLCIILDGDRNVYNDDASKRYLGSDFDYFVSACRISAFLLLLKRKFLKRKNNDIKNGSEFTDPLFPCHCFR